MNSRRLTNYSNHQCVRPWNTLFEIFARSMKDNCRRAVDHRSRTRRHSWREDHADNIRWTLCTTRKRRVSIRNVYASDSSHVLQNTTYRCLYTSPGPDGTVDPASLVAAHLCGVHEIYRVGGAQAIAALAYGTHTIDEFTS